jgi:hypothetical protein
MVVLFPITSALWDSALPFSKVYVFPSIEHAQFALRTFGSFLQAPPADVGEVCFRVCAQCSSYQCQYPPGRKPALFGSTGIGSMPNFYSASLCRKNNISHLKKYSQKQATIATTASSSSSAFSASQLPPSAVGGRIVSRAPIPPFAAANPNVGAHAYLGSTAASLSSSSGASAAVLAAAAAAAASAAAASASAMSWAVPHAAGIVVPPRREFRTTFVFQMLAQHRFAQFREYLKSFAEVRSSHAFVCARMTCASPRSSRTTGTIFFFLSKCCLLLQDENCEPSFIVRLELLRLVSRFIEMNDALFIYQSSHDSAHSMTIMPLPATAASSASSSQSTVVTAALTELAEFDVNVALQRLSIQAVESSSSSSSSSSSALVPAYSSSSSSSTSFSSSSSAMVDAGASHVPDEHAQQLHHQSLRAPTGPVCAGHFYAPAFRLIRNLSMRTDAMVRVLGQNGWTRMM